MAREIVLAQQQNDQFRLLNLLTEKFDETWSACRYALSLQRGYQYSVGSTAQPVTNKSASLSAKALSLEE